MKFQHLLAAVLMLSTSCLATDVNRQYFEKALEVVASFETSSKNPWGSITPDFDRQGVSCGIFQWNIGQGSLPRLVQQAPKELIMQQMPKFGVGFWKACNSNKEEALAIVRSWQDISETMVNGKPKRRVAWKQTCKDTPKELSTLFSTPEMKKLQMDTALRIGQAAWNNAEKWARALRGSDAAPTLREFTAFLDTQVFNGGIAGLEYTDVKKYKDSHPADDHVQVICDWLASAAEPSYQVNEAHKNAKLWSKPHTKDETDAFILFYLRALQSNGDSGKFKPNVLSRRGTILFNDGWVNDTRMSFPALKNG